MRTVFALALILALPGFASADPTTTDPPASPAPSPVATESPEPIATPRGLPPGFDDAIRLPDGATPLPTPEPSPAPIATPILPPAVHDDAAAQPMPIQLTIAGGVATYRDGRREAPVGIALGAAWLGAAFHAPGARHRGFFVGPGMEGTVDGREGPYQLSGGAGVRIGYVWRGRVTESVPDQYVYARVTPFVGLHRLADPEYLHGDEPTFTRRGAGTRIAIGVVAPAWTATVFGGLGGASTDGLASVKTAEEAIACLAIGALVLFTNHLELVYETYDEPGSDPIHRAGIRFGIGF